MYTRLVNGPRRCTFCTVLWLVDLYFRATWLEDFLCCNYALLEDFPRWCVVIGGFKIQCLLIGRFLSKCILFGRFCFPTISPKQWMNERPTRQPQQASSDILHGVLLRGLQQAPKADAINQRPKLPFVVFLSSREGGGGRGGELGGIKNAVPSVGRKNKSQKIQKQTHRHNCPNTDDTREIKSYPAVICNL